MATDVGHDPIHMAVAIEVGGGDRTTRDRRFAKIVACSELAVAGIQQNCIWLSIAVGKNQIHKAVFVQIRDRNIDG